MSQTPRNDLSFKAIIPGIGIALLLGMGPYLIAWIMTPTNMQFSGTLANHNDFSAYIAAMRQGAEGGWLFQFNFSPEYWAPQLMLPLYMLAGKAVSPLGGSYFLWFNILRAGAIVFTLTGFLFFVRQALPNNRRWQLTAWILITFGAGISWLILPLTAPFLSGFNYFPDISGAEWTTLLVSVNPPHYMLGLGLEAILFGSIMRMTEADAGWRWAISGAVIALCLGLVYVYHTAVVGFVIGVYMLVLAWRARKIPWRLWAYAFVVVLPLLPLLFYYGYWVNQDPAWVTYVNSNPNRIAPPPPLGLLIGYGLLALLAVVGMPGWWKKKNDPLPIIWIGANLVLMYVPIVQYSGRFALGLIIPVATLAAYGLEAVILPWIKQPDKRPQLAWLSGRPPDSLRRVIVIVIVLPSTLMVFMFLTRGVLANPDFPNYMPQSEWRAATWLAEQTDEEDLVLAHYPIGNLLPALGNARVFAGQFFLTLHFEDKLSLVQTFWDGNTSEAWRQALINEWNITYVYQGNYEQTLMTGPVTPPGTVVYDEDGIVIYRVSPP